MVNEEAKQFLRLVFSHIVQSIKPKNLLQLQLKFKKNKLSISSNNFTLTKNCYVVGFGKAVFEMASEVCTLLGDHVQKGILSIPEGSLDSYLELNNKILTKKFQVFQGAKNNIPDENSYKAAQAILELVKPLTESDILLVLISGGGSALITYPVPPVTLEEKIVTTKLLSHAGITIDEMNIVRKQLSMIKGGKLTEVAYPCQVVSLILSDVINDPIGTIASGPTVRNEDLPRSGLKIFEKYNLLNKAPKNVLIALNSFINDQKIEVFNNSYVHIIGNNSKALASGKTFLESKNKFCQVLSNKLQGNVVGVVDALSHLTKHICKFMQNETNKTDFIKGISSLPLTITDVAIEKLSTSLASTDEVFLLFGGETTVNVTGKGKGGRNMEMALRYSIKINDLIEKYDLRDFEISFLSAGTDGIDGPTDSAGAISYQGQVNMAKDLGLDIKKIIADNDSYNFFKVFNGGEDLIKIGHTGTNVMDIIILHIQKKQDRRMLV